MQPPLFVLNANVSILESRAPRRGAGRGLKRSPDGAAHPRPAAARHPGGGWGGGKAPTVWPLTSSE